MSLLSWLIEILFSIILILFGIGSRPEVNAPKLIGPSGPGGFLKVDSNKDLSQLDSEFASIDLSSRSMTSWDSSMRNSLLSFMFEDMDAKFGSYLNWIVGNIASECVENGRTLALFFPFVPTNGTGTHYYVFLCFEQPGGFPQIPTLQAKGQLSFNTTEFVQNYNLTVAEYINRAALNSSADVWTSKLIF